MNQKDEYSSNNNDHDEDDDLIDDLMEEILHRAKDILYDNDIYETPY